MGTVTGFSGVSSVDHTCRVADGIGNRTSVEWLEDGTKRLGKLDRGNSLVFDQQSGYSDAGVGRSEVDSDGRTFDFTRHDDRLANYGRSWSENE